MNYKKGDKFKCVKETSIKADSSYTNPLLNEIYILEGKGNAEGMYRFVIDKKLTSINGRQKNSWYMDHFVPLKPEYKNNMEKELDELNTMGFKQ